LPGLTAFRLSKVRGWSGLSAGHEKGGYFKGSSAWAIAIKPGEKSASATVYKTIKILRLHIFDLPGT